MSETFMAREIAEIPQVIERQLARNRAATKALGERLRANPPRHIVTSARGSSDCAAGYLKVLIELMLGQPVASLGPSVSSVYRKKMDLSASLFVTISQSGTSPDILAAQAAAKAAGALTVALVNVESSPLAAEADVVLPLSAGEEKSVAATKSVVAGFVAGAVLVAEWADDREFGKAIEQLPDALSAAAAVRWPEAVAQLIPARSVFLLGRGPTLPVAQEAALKLKETCLIHAEAFSSAEFVHGPMELAGPTTPILVFQPDDAAAASTRASIARIAATGAPILQAGDGGGLSFAPTHDRRLDAISLLTSFYAVAEAVSRAKGRDPDKPRHVVKETSTL